MNAPTRPRAWLPLVVLAVCVIAPLALAQPGTPGWRPGGPPGMPGAGGNMGMGANNGPGGNMPAGMGDVEQKMWVCEKCQHTWPAAGGSAPEKCPKCGTVFSAIKNADGTTTKTAAGRRSAYIGIAVVGVAVLAAIIKGVISMASSSPKKKKKKKVRRPRDDDDDDY